MDYVLRRVTDEDKQFFIKSGVKSPVRKQRPGFDQYMVESLEDNVRMVFIGGQGIMEEDGTERSEMAAYSAVVWNGKCYIVQFYEHSNCVKKAQGYETFIMTYKIKEVEADKCINDEREKFIAIAKKCFQAYGAGGCKTSLCEKVLFINTEVRWHK